MNLKKTITFRDQVMLSITFAEANEHAPPGNISKIENL